MVKIDSKRKTNVCNRLNLIYVNKFFHNQKILYIYSVLINCEFFSSDSVSVDCWQNTKKKLPKNVYTTHTKNCKIWNCLTVLIILCTSCTYINCNISTHQSHKVLRAFFCNLLVTMKMAADVWSGRNVAVKNSLSHG